MTETTGKNQTDIYRSRSWVKKFPNRGWVYIGIEVILLFLVLYYGNIQSIEDLLAIVLLMIILTGAGLWNIFRHINAAVTPEGIAINENLVNRPKTIPFADISDVLPHLGSVYRSSPMGSLYYLAGSQVVRINRTLGYPIFVSVSNSDEFSSMFKTMRDTYSPVVEAVPADGTAPVDEPG